MTQVPNSRIKLVQRANALVITIKAKRNIGICLFLGFWLIGWAAGWVAATGALIFGPFGFMTFFLLFWLTFWTWGGLSALSALVWMLAGKEEISISDHTILILRRVPFRAKPISVPMDAAKDMRALANPKERHEKNFKGWRKADAGTILLDHGNTRLGFGLELEPNEARKLVDTITAIFPTLKES